MTARFDHTIIAARDAVASAESHRRSLEADPAPSEGPFVDLWLDGARPSARAGPCRAAQVQGQLQAQPPPG